MELTQAQRDMLLDRAGEAVRARLAVTPDTDPDEVARLSEVATMAVTDAVTRGEWPHTQIAELAGCTRLDVISMITDWSAQARALKAEREAAAYYVGLVRRAAEMHARRRVDAQGYGTVTQIAREIGVRRQTVYDWLEKVV